MSYILDALRKADAERERGGVPGLHAQPVPAVSGDAETAPRMPPWAWAIGGLTIALIGVGAWQMMQPDAAPPRVAIAAATPQPSLSPPVAAPAPPPEATSTQLAPPPVTPAPAVQAPAPVPAAPMAAPPAPPARVAQAPQPRPAKRPAPERSIAAAPPARPAAPAAEPQAPIPALAELPEHIRRELPAMTIGGSIYSPNPKNRFVIVNGQIFHENDKLAPDLWLETIQLKSAVLKYKDLRYRITF